LSEKCVLTDSKDGLSLKGGNFESKEVKLGKRDIRKGSKTKPEYGVKDGFLIRPSARTADIACWTKNNTIRALFSYFVVIGRFGHLSCLLGIQRLQLMVHLNS
jgi:hypothetical protein